LKFKIISGALQALRKINMSFATTQISCIEPSL